MDTGITIDPAVADRHREIPVASIAVDRLETASAAPGDGAGLEPYRVVTAYRALSAMRDLLVGHGAEADEITECTAPSS